MKQSICVLEPIPITSEVGSNGLVQLRQGVWRLRNRRDSVMADGRVADQWSIPDDLWECIAALIPRRQNRHPYGGGRPPVPDRVCLEAILYVLRTGRQWKALDATRFVPGSTAHDRFQLWQRQGVFR